MMQEWIWLVIAALVALVAYQRIRFNEIQRQSKHREELFQIVTENAADMIALVDVKGHRLYNSPAYKKILGYSPAELSETSAFEQIHPDDRFKVLEASREARRSGVGKTMEYRIRHKNGSWKVLESVASTVRNEKGEVAKLVIVNRDVTERKLAEEQLEHNSFHDALTGLPNRRLFLDRLGLSFIRTQRKADSHYAVLLVDVDGFKGFNDTMGTAAGDQVIVEIGRRMAAALREQDTVARPQSPGVCVDAVLSRLGGDEFTILLDGINDPSDAMRVANRVKLAVAIPILIEGRAVCVSASVGIALSATPHRQAEDLLQDADAAMRRAKALGGSRCELFDEAMQTQAVNRLKLESELRTALDEGQFHVYYQPMVALKTRQITGFEALLRWSHPQQGVIAADKFLEAAEDTGLMISIGQQMFVEACRQMRKWQVKYAAAGPLSIAINVSARQLAHANLVSDLRDAIHASGIGPGSLQLEMSESLAMTNPRLTSSVLSQLRSLGVRVILQEFGTGHFSLSELRHFPVEGLKIDRSLVAELLTDSGTCDVVEMIITLARKMNVRVIAEGVETVKHLDRLQELGCQFGQGYLFSPPVDAGSAEKLLSRQSLQPLVSGVGAQ
ncbi:MAG TPA: EAL domain-containing protein [Candidatus Sulfotelmatobacter sp.]|nr:EAL domain-containing protein [Candidatus Sulfotelmatobacter sp.]